MYLGVKTIEHYRQGGNTGVNLQSNKWEIYKICMTDKKGYQ